MRKSDRYRIIEEEFKRLSQREEKVVLIVVGTNTEKDTIAAKICVSKTELFTISTRG
jgi:FixJ family two-component response regulator